MNHGIRKAVWATVAVTVLLITQQSVMHSCRILQAQHEEEDTPPSALLLAMQEETTIASSLSKEQEHDDSAINGKLVACVWENDYNLVHVVYSRFMQHQPNLMDLGRARLILFLLAISAIALPPLKKR